MECAEEAENAEREPQCYGDARLHRRGAEKTTGMECAEQAENAEREP
jgi:hypothetical protein